MKRHLAPSNVRRIVVVAASGGLALAAACASLNGLSGGDGTTTTPIEGGAETGPLDARPPSSDPCAHATYPPPPAKDDDPNGQVPPFVLAVRDESVSGTVDGGAPIGFDLDGVCTCFADTSTAHGGAPSCVVPEGGASPCDGDGGVDRQISSLLAAYTVPPGGGATPGPTVLLKVTKYNGRANDSDVFVGLIDSPGIFDRSACTSGGDAGAPPYPPTWQGCDRFALDETSVLPGTNEPLRYLPGYVTDHVLVVRPSSKPVSFVVGNTTLLVTGALLAMRLTPVDDQLRPIVPPPETGTLFHVDGMTGGRVNVSDALRAIAISQALVDGGPLCGFPNFYNSVKSAFVCPGADIATNGSADFTGAACDALSFAASFTADPAQLGETRKAAKPGCADPSDPAYASYFDCSK